MLETKDRFLKVGQQLVLGPYAHDPLFVAEPHHLKNIENLKNSKNKNNLKIYFSK